jgi:hypothetical protein
MPRCRFIQFALNLSKAVRGKDARSDQVFFEKGILVDVDENGGGATLTSTFPSWIASAFCARALNDDSTKTD